MKKEENKELSPIEKIDKDIEDIQANITLLSGWQQAHENKSTFAFGITTGQYAIHVNPDDTGYPIVLNLIDAQLETAGKQLMQLRTAKADMDLLGASKHPGKLYNGHIWTTLLTQDAADLERNTALGIREKTEIENTPFCLKLSDVSGFFPDWIERDGSDFQATCIFLHGESLTILMGFVEFLEVYDEFLNEK